MLELKAGMPDHRWHWRQYETNPYCK